MLSVPKRFTAYLISFVLAFSLCPLSAFADVGSDEGTTQVSSEIQEANSDQATTIGDAESDVSSKAESGSMPDYSASAVTVAPEAGGTVLNPHDALGYMYVDHQALALDDIQTIAVGLKDESIRLSTASLELVRAGDAQVFTYESASTVDSAAGFTLSFAGENELGAYSVSKITYTVEGSDETYIVDFSLVGESEGYSFEVVSSDLAQALSAASDSDVTAMVLKEDGNVQVTDSIDEAIALSDATGVAASEEQAQVATLSSDAAALWLPFPVRGKTI